MSDDRRVPGLRVLLAEDQLLIGMDLADELEGRGFEVAGAFPSSREALGWLASNTPDVAILDVKLKDGSSLELARELRRRGVPFVFFSGAQGTQGGLRAEFPDVPWVEKPARLDQLVQALEEARILPPAPSRREPRTVADLGLAGGHGVRVSSEVALDTRRLIQEALIWSGHYDGMIDGRFGLRTLSAIERFQRSIGREPTGTLAADEIELLTERARAAKQAVGFQAYSDPSTGLTIGLPLRLAPFAGRIERGSRFASPDGRVDIELLRFAAGEERLRDLFRRLEKAKPNRHVTYSAAREDWFVMTGIDGTREFYVRAQERRDGVAAFTTTWDGSIAETFEPVVVAMSNAFAAPQSAPPP